MRPAPWRTRSSSRPPEILIGRGQAVRVPIGSREPAPLPAKATLTLYNGRKLAQSRSTAIIKTFDSSSCIFRSRVLTLQGVVASGRFASSKDDRRFEVKRSLRSRSLRQTGCRPRTPSGLGSSLRWKRLYARRVIRLIALVTDSGMARRVFCVHSRNLSPKVSRPDACGSGSRADG